MNEETAELIAGQTAVLAIILERLFAEGKLNRGDIVSSFYDALEQLANEGGSSRKGAALRHLLSIIEDESQLG